MTEVGNLAAIEGLTGDPDSMPAKVMRAGRCLAEYHTVETPLIGHVSIGIFADGTYSCGFQCPEDHGLFGPILFTAYIKEIIERELTGKQSADDYAKEFLL